VSLNVESAVLWVSIMLGFDCFFANQVVQGHRSQ